MPPPRRCPGLQSRFNCTTTSLVGNGHPQASLIGRSSLQKVCSLSPSFEESLYVSFFLSRSRKAEGTLFSLYQDLSPHPGQTLFLPLFSSPPLWVSPDPLESRQVLAIMRYGDILFKAFFLPHTPGFPLFRGAFARVLRPR